MTAVCEDLTFRSITCARCGVLFAVSEDHLGHLKRKKCKFHCPNGHHLYIAGEEELGPTREELVKQVDTLKDDLASAKHRAEQAEARALQAVAKADQEHVTGEALEDEPEQAKPAQSASTGRFVGKPKGKARPPVVHRVHCAYCRKGFALAGLVLQNHLRDMHKVDLRTVPAAEWGKHYTHTADEKTAQQPADATK